MKALRILIADDHAAVRRAIRSLLESHPEWAVSEATDGQQAVEQARLLDPDIVLLDVTMPRMDGLEATRQIVADSPATAVFILTTHESIELADEVRRAGALGMIDKYAAHEVLIRAIESFHGSKAAIHLAGSVVGRARHIGAFFSSTTERYRVLAPFIAEGLEQGESAVHVIDPPSRNAHVQRLREAGVDVEPAEEQGQARFIPWGELYVPEGRFAREAVHTRLVGALQEGTSQGFPLTRLIAHMEWALQDWPGVEDLVQYESELNDILPRFDDVVICAYDLSKFRGDILADLLRSHPAAILGGALRDNTFYVPPGQMLEELRARQPAR
jgi:DNA-binding NarL/FixJ family response regulator